MRRRVVPGRTLGGKRMAVLLDSTQWPLRMARRGISDKSTKQEKIYINIVCDGSRSDKYEILLTGSATEGLTSRDSRATNSSGSRYAPKRFTSAVKTNQLCHSDAAGAISYVIFPIGLFTGMELMKP